MAELFYYIDPDNVQYLLNDGVNRYLAGFSGLGYEGGQQIVERVPYLDGADHKSMYTAVREISVVLDFVYDAQAELIEAERALRAALNAYKDKDTPGVLRVERAGTTRDIAAMLVAFAEASADRQVFNSRRALVFHAHDPWFYDPTEVSEAWAMPTQSGMSIPMSIPLSFSASVVTGYITVQNDGDVETWPVIRVDGPSDSPQITNTETGKAMKLTAGGGLLMDAGDYVDIDMENATVQWYDASAGTTTSVLSKVSSDSEFWPLVRGGNRISILVANPAGGSVTVSFYNRFLSA